MASVGPDLLREGPGRARVGLCWDCAWARRVASARGAVFFLCRRAEGDPAYPKYPALPRLRCAGYESAPDSPAPPSGERTG
jgi:hypothetical protein